MFGDACVHVVKEDRILALSVGLIANVCPTTEQAQGKSLVSFHMAACGIVRKVIQRDTTHPFLNTPFLNNPTGPTGCSHLLYVALAEVVQSSKEYTNLLELNIANKS